MTYSKNYGKGFGAETPPEDSAAVPESQASEDTRASEGTQTGTESQTGGEAGTPGPTDIPVTGEGSGAATNVREQVPAMVDPERPYVDGQQDRLADEREAGTGQLSPADGAAFDAGSPAMDAQRVASSDYNVNPVEGVVNVIGEAGPENTQGNAG